jgi:hypothetical protein
MKQRCNPPRLEEHDWSQFDFTRWNLDAVAQNTVAKAIAGLTQQFFESPEWQESVQASMPQLQQAAVGVYRDHANGLRESRATAERDFDERAVNARTRADDVRRALAASAAPQTPEAGKDVYHLAVRVTGADPLLGFPGAVVEIADPRSATAPPIATATTDVDGNATLTVGAELARELDKQDTTVTVSSPGGKVLARLTDGVCVRLNQVETKIIAVKESAETEPLKEAALATRTGREILLQNAEGRLQSLAKDREERLANLDCAVNEADAIVADLEKPPDLGQLLQRASRGQPQAGTPADTGTAPRAPAPTPAPATSPVRPGATPAPTAPTARPATPAPIVSPARPTVTTSRTAAVKAARPTKPVKPTKPKGKK